MNDTVKQRIEEEKERLSGKLDLSGFGLTELPEEIKDMVWLTELYAFNNQISDISVIKDLQNLIEIHFGYNQISDISILGEMHNLKTIFFNSNPIRNISTLKEVVNLKLICFRDNRINDISPIAKLKELITIDFSNNHITDISPIAKLKELTTIDFSTNHITDISPIAKLKELTTINFSSNHITDISPIKELNNLSLLNLTGNKISSLNGFEYSKKIIYLNLSANRISGIVNLEGLDSLIQLSLEQNKIAEIEGIANLKNLTSLNLNQNQINDVAELKSLVNSPIVKRINLGYNEPLNDIGLYFNDGTNHLNRLKDYFAKLENTNTVKYQLPLKIMLLGNHHSGKSTFLDFFQSENDVIENKDSSTHILRIVPYSLSEDKTSLKKNNLPDAYFYDFGGQDYYHGLYQAFYTAKAQSLIFWHNGTNRNFISPDRNGHSNFNYNLQYWLGQHKYFGEKILTIPEQIENEYSRISSIFLIETHIDDTQYKLDFHNLKEFNGYIQQRFAVSLKKDYKQKNNQLTLKYIKDYVQNSVQNREEQEIEEAKLNLYHKINELQSLTGTGNERINISALQNHYSLAKDDIGILKGALSSLNDTGMILYYDKGELSNYAWLNPTALVEFVHENILKREKIQKGEISKDDFEAEVEDLVLIEMLKENKVIFHDKHDNKYIIPNYLPLLDQNSDDYFIFNSNHVPDLVLKFEHFIPFGFINQLICHFGQNPDKKSYRRNNLIFTLDENIKVMIYLNFQAMSIELSISIIDNNFALPDKFLRGLLYVLIDLFYGINIHFYEAYLEEDEQNKELYKIKTYSIIDKYCKHETWTTLKRTPNDLFISINNHDYVNLMNLESEKTFEKILAYNLDEKGDLNKDKGRLIGTYPFKKISFNENIISMKKIFISYSKKDLALINTFQDHLSSLKLDGIVGTWYCTELLAGQDWDLTIQKHFDESDIICFMVSPNFMKTDYIFQYEVEKALERKKNGKEIIIVPIILDFCVWQTEKYPIQKYTALPYTAKPVKDFANENEAWFIIVESLRIMINSNNQFEGDDKLKDFENSDIYENTTLRKLFERISNSK